MFIQSVFKQVNRWCIHNIFLQFIPVFCYSNAEGVFSDSYEERLRKLELPTLSYRRLRGDMIEVHYVYKIIQGHYDPEASTIIKLMNDTEQRLSTRTNSRKVVYVFTYMAFKC
jgi:hypothetical protein